MRTQLRHSNDSDVSKAQILLLGFAEAIFILLRLVYSLSVESDLLIMIQISYQDEPDGLMLRVGEFCKRIERCFRKHSARPHESS